MIYLSVRIDYNVRKSTDRSLFLMSHNFDNGKFHAFTTTETELTIEQIKKIEQIVVVILEQQPAVEEVVVRKHVRNMILDTRQ